MGYHALMDFIQEFDSGRGFSSVSHHPRQHSHPSQTKFQSPMSSYSPPETFGHPSATISGTYSAPSDTYGPPADAYVAPEAPASIPQPQYSGHYTYEENLTPSSQISYYDTKN